MTARTPPTVLVTIPDIAEFAGVGRSAVGNWRKRHEDFPSPRMEAPSFGLQQVMKKLEESHRE